MSRKSDVALPTIMNVFLMIAVILVASSFLLKAFGIDIWGFLKNLFGGMALQPNKILFIKMDPGSTPQINQFYLTSDKYAEAEPNIIATARYVSRFMPLELPEKNCVIYTVDENSGGMDLRDEGYTYYVKPGTIIQEGCGGNLGDCIGGYITKSGCVPKEAIYLCGFGDLELSPAKCSKVADEFAFVNCGCEGGEARCDEADVAKRQVENQLFLDRADFVKECKDERARKCNLLVPDIYRIQYGLICDNDGKWYLCTENTNPTDKHQGAKCNWDGNIGTWKITQVGTSIECAYPLSTSQDNNCIFNKKSVSVGEQVVVGGYIKKENGEPIKDVVISLLVWRGNTYTLIKNMPPTNDAGYTVTSWYPDPNMVGTNKYILSFYGDRLYKGASSSEFTLTVSDRTGVACAQSCGAAKSMGSLRNGEATSKNYICDGSDYFKFTTEASGVTTVFLDGFSDGQLFNIYTDQGCSKRISNPSPSCRRFVNILSCEFTSTLGQTYYIKVEDSSGFGNPGTGPGLIWAELK